MNWISQLTIRERVIVISASVVLLFLAIHALVWQPLIDQHHYLSEEIELAKSDVQWVQQNAPLLKVKKQQPQAVISGSLVSWIDLRMSKNKLKKQLKRIKPIGDTGVKLWLEGAEFEQVMLLIQEITAYKVNIEELRISAAEIPSIVDVTVTLTLREL
ncbi:MAG: type II secretion system protein M [Gammaproteobacteria bacterium]|nr:type II secretion system protein M [Gammaproteobacteria bacterium]